MVLQTDERPIGSVAALGRKLGFSVAELERIAVRVNRHYSGPVIVRKPGKKPRKTYPARPKLRRIHERILERVLSKVRYPSYLKGGIRGRGYLESAGEHAGAAILFGQDVEDFYGSITVAHIHFIFQDVLHFPPKVAELLAKLCSRKGSLVQGGVASTHIANLALYRTEPGFSEAMISLGAKYNRFVDDCHVSSQHRIPRHMVPRIESMARSMLIRHGFRPKRKKQFVGSRQQVMKVHNLSVNTSVSQPEKKRKALRTGLHQFRLAVDATAKWNGDLEGQYLRLAKRIGQLGQTNKGLATTMRKRLKALASFRSTS
jgi:hypothetical protein